MFIIHTNIKNRSWANAYIWKTDGSRGGVSANYGEACKENIQLASLGKLRSSLQPRPRSAICFQYLYSPLCSFLICYLYKDRVSLYN